MLLACTGSDLRAQVLDLGGGEALPKRAALGDTLEIGVRLQTDGRRLTSVGLVLQYDPALLQPVEPIFAPAPGFLADAVIYENRIVAGNIVSSERVRLVVVAASGSDGQRLPMMGQGLLATVDFVVVGFADSADVRLVTDGGDRPVFTELGRPGVQSGFGASEPGHQQVELDPSGFLPLPDVTIEAGRVLALSLRGRSATESVEWMAQSESPGLVVVEVAGDSLLLRARARSNGTAVIDYTATDELGSSVGSGRVQVQVRAAPSLLADPGLFAPEDFGTLHLLLQDFLSPAADIPATAVWQATVDAPLTGGIEAGSLVLTAPEQWFGVGTVTLHLRHGRDVLDTLQLTLSVSSVNDAPRLTLPADPLVARVGTRTLGPALSDWISDADDSGEDLRVEFEADTGMARVEAWLQDGRVQLRGLEAGETTVQITVIDPAGGFTIGILHVEVAAAAAAPAILVPEGIQLQPGESLVLPLEQLVSDADSPDFDALEISVSTVGSLLAVIEAGSLILTAPTLHDGVLTATVQLSVVDVEGNTAFALWTVQLEAEIQQPSDVEPVGGVVDEIVITPPEVEAFFGFTETPRISVVSGGASTVLEMAAAIEPEGSARAFSVSGAGFIDVQIDSDTGRLTLSALAGQNGREVLVMSAVDALGRVAIGTVEVLVNSDTADDALRLQRLPELNLDSDEEITLDLDDYITGAEGEVIWSATPLEGLLTVQVRGRLLFVQSGSACGRGTVLIAAQDQAGRQASEILHAQIHASTNDGQEPLRLRAPEDLALAAGAHDTLDLRALVEGEGHVSWSIAGIDIDTEAERGLELGFTGDSLLVLHAQADAVAGWRDLLLRAQTPSGILDLRLRIAITSPPRLALRPFSEAAVVAGLIQDVLAVDDLVSIGVNDSIEWSIGGGVLLQAGLSPSRRLRVNAVDALPGREVLQVTATFAGEIRRRSIPVRVRAPQVTVQPDTLRLAGVGIGVAIGEWVQGEIPATDLHWEIASVPEGITAWWDLETRRLQVAGDGAGDVYLQAWIASGLRVGDAKLPVLQQAPAQVQALDLPDWTLQAPVLSMRAAEPLLVPLSNFVRQVAATDLRWSVSADGEGRARIIDDHVELSGSQGFSVVLEAVHLLDPAAVVHRLEFIVPVQPLADRPPAVMPALDLVWGLDGHGDPHLPPSLWVRIDADSNVGLRLEVTGAQQSKTWDMEAGTPVRIPLPIHASKLALTARGLRDGLVVEDQRTLHAGWLAAGDEVASPDGSFLIGNPVGSKQPVAIALTKVDAETGAFTVIRQGPSTPLSIRVPHGAGRWNSLQQMTAAGWTKVPGSRRTALGIEAFTDRESGSAAYRAVAMAVGSASPGESVVSEEKAPRSFPNPFNASVTLPTVPGSRTLRIYDAVGRLLRSYEIGSATAVHWDGLDENRRKVASGVYFYRFLPGNSSTGGPGARTVLDGVSGGKLTLVR